MKNNLEEKAKKLICEAGKKGVLQSELWKKLSVSSREGSRLAKKFEEKGIIKREKELGDGRWTYRMYFLDEPVTLDSVDGCPCMVCIDLEKCYVGGNRDPLLCHYLTAWIDPRISEEPELDTVEKSETEA
jgi:hypothetical protein